MRTLVVVTLAFGLSACAPSPPPVAKAPSPDVHPPPPALDDREPLPAPAEPEPADPEPGDPCANRAGPMAPVMVAPEQWDARKGAAATKLSELQTSKEDPAQQCGALRSYRFLASLSCDDGSSPLADAKAAQRARSGNVGPGGRCGNVVDVYRVHCPEGDYDVFVDMYWCTESLVFDEVPQGA